MFNPIRFYANNLNVRLRNLRLNRNYCRLSSLNCWKCGGVRQNGGLHCKHCRVIQPPQQTDNFFKVFDLDVKFDVNLHQLTQKYRKMQNVLHPDRFSNSSQDERKISEEYSSLVNKAYSTLQVPLSRALHMLLLNNLSIGEDNEVTDPQFLMKIMELNEQIEDASTPESLRALNKKNKNTLKETIKEISDFFENGDVERAKASIIKLKYYNSISKRINDILREKGIVD